MTQDMRCAHVKACINGIKVNPHVKPRQLRNKKNVLKSLFEYASRIYNDTVPPKTKNDVQV